MSASKLNTTDIFQSASDQPLTTSLKLAASSIRIRKNGIEFPTLRPIPTWTEMTVEIESPLEAKKVRCAGVVVACNGNRHNGYVVALVFTNLSRQARARLNTLALVASLR